MNGHGSWSFRQSVLRIFLLSLPSPLSVERLLVLPGLGLRARLSRTDKSGCSLAQAMRWTWPPRSGGCGSILKRQEECDAKHAENSNKSTPPIRATGH